MHALVLQRRLCRLLLGAVYGVDMVRKRCRRRGLRCTTGIAGAVSAGAAAATVRVGRLQVPEIPTLAYSSPDDKERQQYGRDAAVRIT